MAPPGPIQPFLPSPNNPSLPFLNAAWLPVPSGPVQVLDEYLETMSLFGLQKTFGREKLNEARPAHCILELGRQVEKTKSLFFSHKDNF